MRSLRPHRRARRIFISYSREGGQAHAVSLYQGFVQVLGNKAVFLDVGADAMEAGRSWKESVREALAGCDTVVLVFDPRMAERLAEPGNAVLFELQTALEYGMSIVCVRVDGATVPRPSDLPPALGDLPNWHSPEVHSDAVVADIERVIKEVTGRVPGQVPVVDRWDITVLGVLSVIGLVGWFTIGVRFLNLWEILLWGTVLVIPWLIWMAGRRVLAVGNRGRASLSYRQAGSWLAVLIISGSGLLLAGRFIYGLPELPAGSGILVARLEGDPSDSYQGDLVRGFQQPTEGGVLSRSPANAAPLARRIGFSPFIRSASGHTEAFIHGTSARAAVVLWGSLLSPKGAAPARLGVSLTFMRNDRLYKMLGSELVGAMESSDVNGLNGDLGLLTDALPGFLEGYSRYHRATSEAELDPLVDEFGDIIEDLEKRSTEDDGNHEALDEILASVHFYHGNTLLALGRRQEAISAYEAAVGQKDKTEGEIGNRFIEAANNLGWLLKAEGDTSRAVAILTAVDRTCGDDYERPRARAYVSYNLGNLKSDKEEYGAASDHFKRAIECIQNVREPHQDTTDVGFYASSQQFLAYSLLRLAATANDRNAAALLKDAEEALTGGVDALEDALLDVPEYFDVTHARIHIEGRKWGDAIDLLTAIDLTNPDAPELRRANVHSLLAGAYWCVGKKEEALQHMKALSASGDVHQGDDGFTVTNIEAILEATRIQNMCSETGQTGDG